MARLIDASVSFEDRITPFASAYSGLLARFVLRERHPYIIGITGSVGKTTTKEVIASVLMHETIASQLGRVWKAHGNMNARKGFSQAILAYDSLPQSPREWISRLVRMPRRAVRLAYFEPYANILILEYALGKISSVKRSVGIARPNIAIVTAVGPAHLERWRTIEAIAADKSALVKVIPSDGLVILGADNEHSAAMASLSRAPVVMLSGQGQDFARAAARAVCKHLGVPDPIVEHALAEGAILRHRQEFLDLGRYRVLDDSYNANPLSVEYGLRTFANSGRPHERRVAILGGMAELGSQTERYHREIGEHARASSHVLVGVGELAKLYRPDYWFATSSECATGLTSLLREHDYIFVKGSASIELGIVIRALKSRPRSQPIEQSNT